MGWCSGTVFFDRVVGHILRNEDYSEEEIIEEIQWLTGELEEMDWDCQGDSGYADNHLVQSAWRQMHPRWYEED